VLIQNSFFIQNYGTGFAGERDKNKCDVFTIRDTSVSNDLFF